LVSVALLQALAPQRAAAEQLGMTCDAFVIAPDGTIATAPLATDLLFSTVGSVMAPSSARPGEVFTISAPSEELTGLVSDAAGFSVISHRDFLRVFEVAGATVVPGSVGNSPPSNATAESTATTISLGLSIEVPGGGSVTFPSARADLLVGQDASEVIVSLARFEDTVEVQNADGSTTNIRAVCTPDPNQLATTIVQGPPLPGTGSPVAMTALLATFLITSGLAATAAARRGRQAGTSPRSTK
jgi:hypothetical protein